MESFLFHLPIPHTSPRLLCRAGQPERDRVKFGLWNKGVKGCLWEKVASIWKRVSFSSVSLKDLMVLTFPLGNLKEKCHVPTLDNSLRVPCHQKAPSAAVCSQHPRPTAHKLGALQLSERSWAPAAGAPCCHGSARLGRARSIRGARAGAEHRAATAAAAPHRPQIPALYVLLPLGFAPAGERLTAHRRSQCSVRLWQNGSALLVWSLCL